MDLCCCDVILPMKQRSRSDIYIFELDVRVGEFVLLAAGVDYLRKKVWFHIQEGSDAFGLLIQPIPCTPIC